MKQIPSSKLISFPVAFLLAAGFAFSDETKSGSKPQPFPSEKVSQWQGFAKHDFQVDGANVVVVEPKSPAPGRPWLWRGEFFGAFANADAALVEKGWHVAYMSVPNLFGSPKAMVRWEKFYDALVHTYGLNPKPGFCGMSRGGLYVMNWAALHPDETLAIWLDNAVCDFKSWPGGKLKNLGEGNGSAAEWAKLLAAYDFKNDDEAIGYKLNPVDNLAPLAKAKIPLLLVCADADKTVPYKENSEKVFERYRALGGPVERIIKPGMDHHPHGLTDPQPIVDFFLKAAESVR